MKRKAFGRTQALLPVIGQGTWEAENDDGTDVVAALRAGLDLGMMHIDTAEMYGSGRVESIVGEAIAGRREEVYLVSKVLPSNASRKKTVLACEASLKRLRVERLDCYLLHWPGSHPIEETIGAFEELLEAGKIGAWGVSNFDERELEEVVKLAGPGKLACNQVLYHLEERSIEHAVIPWCEAHGVAVVGYTPFGRRAVPTSGERGRVLQTIADKHGVSIRNVILAFLTRRASLFAIPKASHLEHVRDNACAGELSLEPTELEAIDRAFPLGPRRSGVPML
jgi:diketogulonate reductase-like aldo/keto reductase